MTSEQSATFSWDAVARYLRELTLGEYEILTELGRGGMAAVYLAHEHALNRKVALKVMSPSIMMTEGMVDRFYAEAVTQANLTHANIVGVHSVRRDQELHYFAMHYVPGRSLQQVLRAEQAAQRPLSIPVIQSLLYQVGSALAYAHRRGVIHRDIKPANVLLNADGDAVVTDFGIAKVASNPSQTMTGTVVGTAPYMSPEQCYAAELTGASDQYSLGILAYELLTGNPPFLGNSFSVMQAHTLETPVPISARRPDCPPEFEAVVHKMLSKRPEDRYADVNAALGALDGRAASSRADDPVRMELVRLADVAGVEAALGDVLRVPLSPMPRTRRATPGGHPRLGTPPAGYRRLTPESSRVIMLRLGDPPAKVESGEVVRLEVEAMDIHGAPLDGLPLHWSSSNPKIARVKPDSGEIEALTPGSADIVVSCESAVATARLVIREPSVARIVGVAMPEFVEVGDKVSLRVNAFDARGVILNRPVRWSMANVPSATLTAEGVLTARAAGSARVVATVDETTTEFRISVRGPSATTIELSEIPDVLAIGESIGLSVTVRDKRGNVLTGRDVSWTSSDPTVAEVDPRGTVSGLAVGETLLEARCDDARAVTHVAVGIVPITTLEVSGLPEHVTQGAKKRIEVKATDPEGRVRKIPATWTSSAPDVASIDSSNQLTTLSPGTAILRVRCGSSERSFPIEVRENVAISQRALKALSGVPRPAASGLLKGFAVAGSIAVIGALIAFLVIRANEVEPVAGPQLVTKGDSATVGVQEPPVVTPPPVAEPPVAAGDTTLRLAIGRIASMRVNQVVAPRLQASRGGTNVTTPSGARWSSSDPNILDVEQRTGRVTARREGTATLVARIGDDSAYTSIRVDRIAVGRVIITSVPALTSLRVGDSAQARARANDASGNELSSRPVQWTIEPAGLATVDADGLVRASAEGTARLIASVENIRDTLSLTILPRPRAVQPPDPQPKLEVKEPEPKTTSSTGTGNASSSVVPPPPSLPPLSAADVTAAADEIIRAITSQDADRITALYARNTDDDTRRYRDLTGRMQRASNGVRLIGNASNVAQDQRSDGERPTARIRRTFEFAYAVTRARPLLDLELSFRREGAGWRLQSFRILNNPSY